MSTLSDAFTADEIARASGVPRGAVDALVVSGELQSVAGTRFFTGKDALRAGRLARQVARRLAEAEYRIDRELFSTSGHFHALLGRRRKLPAVLASLTQATLIVLMIWLASRSTESAHASAAPVSHLVFL